MQSPENGGERHAETLEPSASDEARGAAHGLRYRDFMVHRVLRARRDCGGPVGGWAGRPMTGDDLPGKDRTGHA